jgi:carbonic anhydrase
VPGVSIFLDVDDLKSIDQLEAYVDGTAVVMIFVSKGYFKSTNCARPPRSRPHAAPAPAPLPPRPRPAPAPLPPRSPAPGPAALTFTPCPNLSTLPPNSQPYPHP